MRGVSRTEARAISRSASVQKEKPSTWPSSPRRDRRSPLSVVSRCQYRVWCPLLAARSNASAMGALLDNSPHPPGEASSRKRKLAAILHADVVGFSRLMGEDEAGTHQALGELRRAVDPLIATHGGRIVGTAGDSVLADFSSVVDALGCALEMQRAARAMNDPIPLER